MLLRGTSGELRRLVNEDAIADSLRRRGFDVIDPIRLSADEVIRRCVGARVVVGVEGNHLAHGAVTVADGGAFLVIQPPNRFHHLFKDFCDMMSVRYGFVVGTRTGQGDDFIADPDQINRLLDQMDACPSPADAVF
jgi:capsular polysaccharide biosynthesis protein